jgi:hypothetical protein
MTGGAPFLAFRHVNTLAEMVSYGTGLLGPRPCDGLRLAGGFEGGKLFLDALGDQRLAGFAHDSGELIALRGADGARGGSL